MALREELGERYYSLRISNRELKHIRYYVLGNIVYLLPLLECISNRELKHSEALRAIIKYFAEHLKQRIET